MLVLSIMSKFWSYAFHRQHKPPSSHKQRIFPLILIATIRQIFCLSALLLMRIWCQSFPSWIPCEHSDSSLRLQPHSPIKPDILSFAKESCLITNKADDFYYFWTIYLFTLLITIDYNGHSNVFNQSMFAYILLIVYIPHTCAIRS